MARSVDSRYLFVPIFGATISYSVHDLWVKGLVINVRVCLLLSTLVPLSLPLRVLGGLGRSGMVWRGRGGEVWDGLLSVIVAIPACILSCFTSTSLPCCYY